MLHPVKMSKVRAICLKQVAGSVIKELQNMSVVHLKDAQLPETERAGPLPSYDEISSRLIRIRSMKESLGKTGKTAKKKYAFASPLKDADELLRESDRLQLLLKEKEDVARELDSNLAQQKALSDLSDLHIDFSKLQSDSLQFILVKTGGDKEKKLLAVLSARKNCAYAQAGGVVLVAIPKGEDAKFAEQFGSILPVPSLSGTPRQEIAELKGKEAALREKIEAAQNKLQRFSDTHYPKLAAVEESLSIEAERAKTATMFSATDSLYYIEGYVESAKVKHLALELHQKFGKKIHVYDAGIDEHHDAPPTLLNNSKFVQPFQYLAEFISTPQYSEIDPSIFLALLVPLMYALIFGDAGFAILSALVAFYLIKRSQPGGILNQVSTMWLISSIPAFILGIAFDEWFGFTHTALLAKFGFPNITLYTALLQRVESIQTLMLITIFVGMAHLALGFILGAANEWRHSRKHAFAKICWLGIEISGFFLVAVGMFNTFTFMLLPAGALFLLSAAGLFWSEGAVSLFEIPGLASNIMSYIRIAAVGVGGTILAEAINELLFPHFSLTPLGIIFFIITAIAYMVILVACCIISMFESFVHGARLNVVEFFGKFYKGNGLPFAPFRAERVYTEETA